MSAVLRKLYAAKYTKKVNPYLLLNLQPFERFFSETGDSEG